MEDRAAEYINNVEHRPFCRNVNKNSQYINLTVQVGVTSYKNMHHILGYLCEELISTKACQEDNKEINVWILNNWRIKTKIKNTTETVLDIPGFSSSGC